MFLNQSVFNLVFYFNMIIGYARVSTEEQSLDLQINALKNYGCERIFVEKKSSIGSRPQLDKTLEHLRPGDILVVWKIDRLGRTVKQLINLINQFEKDRIEVVFLSDGIDTRTASGKFMFTIMSAFAELELNLIRERTKAGLAAARARGKVGGRKGIDSSTVKKINVMYQGNVPIAEILKTLKISRSTLYKYLNKKE